MKKNNKGFSLIEVIVVVAVMAILAGGIVVMLNLSSRQLNNAVSEIYAEIGDAKTLAMSKGDYALMIFVQDGKYYTQKVKESDGTVAEQAKPLMSASKFVIFAKNSAGGTITIDSANPGYIRFNRASGAFAEDFTYTELLFCFSDSTTPYRRIEFVKETGKFSLKR